MSITNIPYEVIQNEIIPRLDYISIFKVCMTCTRFWKYWISLGKSLGKSLQIKHEKRNEHVLDTILKCIDFLCCTTQKRFKMHFKGYNQSSQSDQSDQSEKIYVYDNMSRSCISIGEGHTVYHLQDFHDTEKHLKRNITSSVKFVNIEFYTKKYKKIHYETKMKILEKTSEIEISRILLNDFYKFEKIFGPFVCSKINHTYTCLTLNISDLLTKERIFKNIGCNISTYLDQD